MQPTPVHTKVLATLGPASASQEMIGKLLDAGATAFRLNFSHGSPRSLDPWLAAVRAVASRRGVHAAVVGDLCGPKIRLGQLLEQDEGRVCHLGDELTIARESSATRGHATTNYPACVDELREGHRVLVDDGSVRFIVAEKSADAAVCRCTTSGPIRSRKGINLPDTPVSLPAITEEDWKCVDWAVERGLDYLALSFVRSERDVRELRERLRALGSDIRVISKIEKPEAVKSIESIIDASDAVMIARGDLGVELDVARVPIIQKQIIRLCAAASKPVIVATQMLQSMIQSATPTRAEVSDVANAIYDGADALMLSGETAVGSFPMLAVHTMTHVARVTEEYLFGLSGDSAPVVSRDPADEQELALAQGACRMARAIKAKAIVVLSRGGTMARIFAKLRPHVPVLAVSPDAAVLRRMALYFGIAPICLDVPPALEELLPMLDPKIRERSGATAGDAVLIVGGLGAGKPKRSNAVMVYRVGDHGA